MLTKAEQTTHYILEKVAPIFNKKGYAATSMSDITEATGLTKGAIYGNFENKEALAAEAFRMNVNNLLKKVAEYQQQSDSPLQKLFLITDHYRNYDNYVHQYGGCPILNVGVDSFNQNARLAEAVKKVIDKTQEHLIKLVEWGKETGEIRQEVDAPKFAKMMYTRIQGAIFMSQTLNDGSYMKEAADDMDRYIENYLKI